MSYSCDSPSLRFAGIFEKSRRVGEHLGGYFGRYVLNGHPVMGVGSEDLRRRVHNRGGRYPMRYGESMVHSYVVHAS